MKVAFLIGIVLLQSMLAQSLVIARGPAIVPVVRAVPVRVPVAVPVPVPVPVPVARPPVVVVKPGFRPVGKRDVQKAKAH